MTSTRNDRLQFVLLLVNAAGTGAAAAVLAIWPSLIPNIVGIPIRADQYVLAYFLSGSEAAICAICVQGFRAGLSVRTVALRSLLVFHLVTAALSTLAVIEGSNRLILWNAGLRLMIALAIAASLWRARAQTYRVISFLGIVAITVAQAFASPNDIRLRAAFGTANVDVTMFAATKSPIRVFRSTAIPPVLSVLGRDERLALYDKEIVAFLSLRPSTDAVRKSALHVVVRLASAPLPTDEYFLAYRGPDDDAWTRLVSSRAATLRSSSTLTFDARAWPTVLKAKNAYNFVIYHGTRDASA